MIGGGTHTSIVSSDPLFSLSSSAAASTLITKLLVKVKASALLSVIVIEIVEVIS